MTDMFKNETSHESRDPLRGDTVVVANARLIDGTGSAAYCADIVIASGTIVEIESPGSVAAAHNPRFINADGAVVCPGFIDVHSHADNAPLLDFDDLTKIAQGVTTEVTGNCGYSLAPVSRGSEKDFLEDSNKLFDFKYTGWHGVEEWFSTADDHGSVVNFCPLIGHGTLRLATIGSADRSASHEDVRRMRHLLAEALEAGAFGLSSGLVYPPGVYSSIEELLHITSVLPPERVYATHVRDESSRLLNSIEEALTVGRHNACRVQISHLKAAGQQNWGGVGRALELLDGARREGIPVTQDVYPYTASSTSLGACLPPWVHSGGVEAAIHTLKDSALLRDIRRQVEAHCDGSWENIIGGAGYDRIMVADTGSHCYDGMTLFDIALGRKIDPFDALVELLIEENFAATMIVFDMDENDVEDGLRSPYTSIGSDGLPPGKVGLQHPRLYGTFPRVLARYVRERRVLDLSEAIRRMTSLPADTFSIPKRGRIKVGNIADLVCFDPARIDHLGTFQNPALPPTGISWVMQSGHLVMRDGTWLGMRRGSRLVPV